MPLHTLTNFEIQKYYQNESRFNAVYFTDKLPKIKDGPYVINFDKYTDIGTHWLLCMFIIMMLLILIFWGQNIFQKKLKILLTIKT